MKHTNNFDALRLGAALAVVTSHQFWLVQAWQPRPFGPMALGSVAILVFFTISGFFAAASWEADPKAWRFAARRLLRIWPAYAVAVIGSALYIGFTDARPLAQTAAWMFVYKHGLFLPFDWDFFPDLADGRLNPPLWTIGFGVGCSAMFAGAALVFRRHWPLALVAALAWALVAHGIGTRVVDPSSMHAPGNWLNFGAYFALGALASRYPVLQSARGCLAALVLGGLAYAGGWQMVGLALAIPALTVFVGTRSWPVLRRAGRFGQISYGIYLWGWPVQWAVGSVMGATAGFCALAAVALPVLLLLAFASWFLIERPALAAKPSRSTVWPKWATLELDR